MQKTIIHIFGAAGSGTSTLGRYISRELGYTFMDTDDYFWSSVKPEYTVSRPRSERLNLLKEDIENSTAAVISGSLVGWGDPLIPLFSLAVRIVTDTETRIQRLQERERLQFGDRIAPDGDRYKLYLDFLAWAATYDTADASTRSKAMHDHWQQSLPCKLLTLNGAESLEYNFEQVKSALAASHAYD